MIDRVQGPFIHTEKTDAYISAVHLLSLIPVMAAAVVYYGLRGALLILFCAAAFTASDTICARIRKVSRGSVLNPLFCGAVLALMLPPDTPLYVALTGVLFASVIVRQIPGGRGASIVNPPAAGRLFVRIVFPANEAALALPGGSRMSLLSLLTGSKGLDDIDLSQYSVSELVTGRYPSFIGTSCVVMIVIGIIYLVVKKGVRFYGPASYILMLTVLLLVKDLHNDTSETWMFIITSGVMFTAAYLMFDDETTRSFGMISIVSAFICAFITFMLSFKTTGIDLIVVPAVITSAMTGILDYSRRVIISMGRERTNV